MGEIKFRHNKFSTVTLIVCLALVLVVVSDLVHADTILSNGPLTLNFTTGQSFNIVSLNPDYNVTISPSVGNLTGQAFLTTANTTGTLNSFPEENGTLTVNATGGVSVLVNGVAYAAPVSYLNGSALTVSWFFGATLFDSSDGMSAAIVVALLSAVIVGTVFMYRRRRNSGEEYT